MHAFTFLFFAVVWVISAFEICCVIFLLCHISRYEVVWLWGQLCFTHCSVSTTSLLSTECLKTFYKFSSPLLFFTLSQRFFPLAMGVLNFKHIILVVPNALCLWNKSKPMFLFFSHRFFSLFSISAFFPCKFQLSLNRLKKCNFIREPWTLVSFT